MLDEDAGVFLANRVPRLSRRRSSWPRSLRAGHTSIAFSGGFHGRTHAAMALTSSNVKYRGHYEPLPGGVHHVPFPDPLRVGGGGPSGGAKALAVTLKAIEQLFATMAYPDDVAAFIVEPILGEGGYVIHPTRLPARAARDSRSARHPAHCRRDPDRLRPNGQVLGHRVDRRDPDIVIMAKGIASGLPLSGILARRSLIDKFPPSSHGGTYGGNVIACAAALATLDVIEEEGLVENARVQGERLLVRLRAATAGAAGVADVRGRGLMLAIEFADPGPELEPRPDLAKKLLHEALDRHLILLSCGTYGQVVRLIPPLVTTVAEIDQAADIVKESLASL